MIPGDVGAHRLHVRLKINKLELIILSCVKARSSGALLEFIKDKPAQGIQVIQANAIGPRKKGRPSQDKGDKARKTSIVVLLLEAVSTKTGKLPQTGQERRQ